MAHSAAAGGTGLALRRLPELSCVAETPQLLFASPAGQLLQAAQRQSAASEARQLFVAETPSEAAGTVRASAGEGMQERQQQLGQEAAAAPVALAQEGMATAAQPATGLAAAGTACAAAATPGAAADARAAAAIASAAAQVTPLPAAAGVAGLQLQLPLPVLQAVPCSDGLHVALLLGSYAPLGEPEHVLVLQLPASPATLPAAGASTAGRASARHSGAGGSGSGTCCGVRVVAALAVERSKWGQGVWLSPNCMQLAATERWAGLGGGCGAFGRTTGARALLGLARLDS